MIWLIVFIVVFIAVWILLRVFNVVKPQPVTLYFGAPRSGKTMFLTRLAVKYHSKLTTFSNYPLNLDPLYSFNKRHFDTFQFPEYSLLLFDEGSLNGFDNRNFKSNFSENSLEYLKLIGHYKNLIVFANQGWDELDKKIRILTTQVWLVKKLPLFSVAIRIYLTTGIDDISKEPKDYYKFPNLLRLIFDPSVIQLCYRPAYYKYYDSWDRPIRPDIKLRKWVDEHEKNVS